MKGTQIFQARVLAEGVSQCAGALTVAVRTRNAGSGLLSHAGSCWAGARQDL